METPKLVRGSTNGAGGRRLPLPLDLPGLRTRLAGSDRRLAAALTWIAGGLGLACMFYSFFIPQTPGRMGRPTAELIPDLPLWTLVSQISLPGIDDGFVVGVLLLLTGVGCFGAYALAAYLTWRQPAGRRTLQVIFATAFVLVSISMWAFPNVSTDLYNYMMRGRIAAVYDRIPYYTAADEFPDDPIYPYASHRYTAHPGGKFPTWMLLNITLAALGGDDPVTNLMLYRIVLGLMTLGSIALVAMILRELSPPHVLTGTILFGWSPIVSNFGTGKTDTVMVFFLLLGTWLLARHRYLIAALPLSLSCFVKMISLPLVAILFARRIVEGQWKEVLVAGTLFVLTAMFVYTPFSGGFELMARHLGYVGEKGGSAAPDFFEPIFKIGFFAVLAWAVFRRPRTLDATLHAWAIAMLYFSLFLTNFAFSWYLLCFVALAAIARDGRIVAAMVVLSMSSFLLNTWAATSSSSFPLLATGSISRHVVYLFPLALAVTVVGVFTAWKRSRANAGGAV